MGEQRFTQIRKKIKARGVMALVITPGLVAMPWAALLIINSLSFWGQLLQFLFFSGSETSDFHVFTAKETSVLPLLLLLPELQLQEGIAGPGTANTHKVRPLRAASPGSHCKPTAKQPPQPSASLHQQLLPTPAGCPLRGAPRGHLRGHPFN